MTPEGTFFDLLRGAETSGSGALGNDELVHAIVPLCQQVTTAHDAGQVAPLQGVAELFVTSGVLWFKSSGFDKPTIRLDKVREIDNPRLDKAITVTENIVENIDLDNHTKQVSSDLIAQSGTEPERPCYYPGYISWEHELDHHDPLTDVFVLGLILGSLATGLDLTDHEQLTTFVRNRKHLTKLVPQLHPVIARAIVRMTEIRRHDRVQDLLHLTERLERYRDVDESIVDTSLDFKAIDGFMHGNRDTRRGLIAERLQSRLYELTRRNRMIWFKPSNAQMDLTHASVPLHLNPDSVRFDQLFLWQGGLAEELSKGKTIRLDKYVRFEDYPFLTPTLDQIRNASNRDTKEYGSSQLKLILAFLSWTNLRERPPERIRSPLLLLPVRLDKKKGVRDAHNLTPLSTLADVNPVLRHLLSQLYDLDLPEQIDLEKTTVETFYKALQAAIQKSEPGISLKLIDKPSIQMVQRKARRRLTAWKKRSRLSGRGIRRKFEVDYSYKTKNYQPLGLQYFLERLTKPTLPIADLLASTPVPPQPASKPAG